MEQNLDELEGRGIKLRRGGRSNKKGESNE